MKIGDNCVVRLNYSIRIKDGEIVDRNPDDEPLCFTTGRSEVIPALEKGILGMEQGESGSFDVGPEDGFGMRDPKAVRIIGRDDLVDHGNDLAEGMIFRIKDKEGNGMAITVLSLDDDEVVFDLNHPLAGATLTFDVKILEVGPVQ
ncbi:MAG TPA: peptidylprolyl isomerase [bacterium]|nr:peptidylprolyl isomerase [bacterium]